MELNYLSDYGYLTINGIYMHTPAWAMVDFGLLQLWMTSPRRGGNTLIPHKRGRFAQLHRGDEVAYSLPMVIQGWCDMDGNENSDPFAGLVENLAYLNANIVTTDSGFATYAASLVLPDSSELVADIQVERITFGEGHFQDLLWPTLDIVLPDGQFAPVV